MDDFFGRQALVRKLLEHLAGPEGDALASVKRHFLALVGPSGCGKSSVAKAGLLPALRRGALPGSSDWLIAEIVPGANLLDDLAARLLEVSALSLQGLGNFLRADVQNLARALPMLLPRDSQLLLLIDQFEEVFTQAANEAESTYFLALLERAVRAPESRLCLVITLRADFYDRPLMHPGFGDLMRSCTEVVLPLLPHELVQAIQRPIERQGMYMEVGLAADIAADVSEQPGALPLLQYALTELFEARQGLLIPRFAYVAMGGVRGALSRRAEELYQSLDTDGQAAARSLFLRLVTLGEGMEDTRRRVFLSELTSLSSEVEQVISVYGKARLLSFDRDPQTRTPTVEVAHEALIREWGTLHAWLVDSRDDLRIQAHLTRSSQEWRSRECDSGELYRGARLAQALEWAEANPGEINVLEGEFLSASRSLALHEEMEREAQRQREMETLQRLAEAERQRAEEHILAAATLRSRGYWLAAALLATLLLTVFAIRMWTTAERSRSQAQENYRQAEMLRLAAEASTQLLSGANIEVSPLLAIQSLKIGYSFHADTILQRALTFPYARLKLEGESTVVKVAFSLDNQRVWGTEADGVVRAWNISNGQEIIRLDGVEGGATCMAVSPDGQSVATCDDVFALHVWNAATGEKLHILKGHTNQVWSLVFSPDGQRLLSASYDQTLRVWSVDSGEQVLQLDLPATSSGAVFSPDGRFIFAALDDNSARLYDASSGEEIRQFNGHTLPVVVAAYSHDGRWVATGSNDKTARVWDVESGIEVMRLEGHQESVYDVNFSADDRFVLTASLDRTAILWEREKGTVWRRFVGLNGGLYSAAISADSLWVAAGGVDRAIWLWPSGLQPDPMRLDHTSATTYVVASPDGSTLFTANSDGSGFLWDAESGALRFTLSGHQYNINSAAFSPDGRYVATAASDYTVRLWETASGREVRQFTLPDYESTFWVVRFSPDGRMLFVGADFVAMLWDATNGDEIYRWDDETSSVYAAAFSPDGRYLAFSSFTPSLQVWDLSSKQLVWTADDIRRVYTLTFLPDSQQLLVGGDQLWLLEAGSGKKLRQFGGFTGMLSVADVSRDGSLVVAGGEDGVAHLWRVSDGDEIRRFAGQQGLIYGVALTPDGRSLWIASVDNTAMRWELDLAALVKRACSLVGRKFTSQEIEQLDLADLPETCPDVLSKP